MTTLRWMFSVFLFCTAPEIPFCPLAIARGDEATIARSFEFKLPAPSPGRSIAAASFVSFPISDAEFERSAQLLFLSEEQRFSASFLYDRYLRDCAAQWSLLMPKIEALAVLVSAGHADLRIDLQDVELTEDFCDSQRRLASAIRARDELFWAELTPFLAEEQQERLPLLRLQRDRVGCCRDQIGMAAAKIDLIAFPPLLRIAEEFLRELAPILVEYESVVSPLLAEFTRERATVVKRSMRIIFKRQNAPNRDEIDRLFAEFQQLHRPGAELQKRIAAVNNEFARRVEAKLPAPEAAFFKHAYQTHVYGVVYNDPLSQTELLKHVELILEEPGAKAIFADARATYLQAYERISLEMEREFDTWGFETAISGPHYEKYRENMRTLRARRWEAASVLLQELQELALAGSGADFESLRGLIESALRQVTEAQEANADDGFPARSL